MWTAALPPGAAQRQAGDGCVRAAPPVMMPVRPEVKMAKRFVDDGRTCEAFSDLFLVQCPRCQGCASVRPLHKPVPSAPHLPMRRLTCGTCASTQEWPRADIQPIGYSIHRGPVDWYFNRPLWLQTPCCGHVLFAYNSAHLGYLEAFVSADLRDVARHHNQSLASRLPQWMQLQHNRGEVLRGLKRLQARLPEA